jgi:uncharacterized protein (DUF427 family)
MTDALEDRDLRTVTGNRPNSDHPVWTEPCPRRVRAVLDGVTVVDATRALLSPEAGHPPEDVGSDLLAPTDKRSHCPYKGAASSWPVTVGDRVVTDAVRSSQDPLPGRDDINGSLALYWHRMEAWFEEDEEVFDPAMVPFAATHTGQHERDSTALRGVVASGRRTAQAGC